MYQIVQKIANWKMPTPGVYSWIHILTLVIVAISTFLLVYFFRNSKEKVMRRICMIVWIILVVLEIGKQLVMNLTESGFSYQWYIFPFQFCDTPFYILPLIAFLKKGKIHNAVLSYFSFFCLFGGLIVMLYPDGVFCEYAYINIQTMIHHGSMVVIGLFLLIWNKESFKLKFFLKGLIVFGCLIAIAMILNLTLGKYVKDNNLGVLNLFFISPYFDCTLPLLSDIYKKAPYIVFLLTYILGFSFAGFLIYGVRYLVHYLVAKHNERKVQAA